ncbi:MAG: glycosyltransferase family 1 protein [Pseudomonadota bacterium]
MFRRHVPPGTTLLNVGHANLDRTVLAGWRSVPSSRVAVMLHDTIPLDFPDFQRKGSAARFAQTLSVIARFADCVLTPSKAAGAAARRWFPITGNLPEIHVAPLGIDIAKPDQSALPSDLTLKQPYFVTVGTIEPRKNHALLLKVWRDFPTKMRPQLLIIGRRGWRNERVFNALDQGKSDDIVECADLCDSAVSYLLTHCAGALFPSFAEGYGLAPIEAACLGAPLICADLAVTRETLGNIPVYVDPSDVYLWRQNIIRLAAKNRAGRDSWRVLKAPPTWEAHFNQVMSLL